jgi:hypothetical protein
VERVCVAAAELTNTRENGQQLHRGKQMLASPQWRLKPFICRVAKSCFTGSE